MAQVTLYLDDSTAARLRAVSAAAGVSQSRWVAELIRRRVACEWPKEVVGLAGAWADFPDPAELRAAQPVDDPRVSL